MEELYSLQNETLVIHENVQSRCKVIQAIKTSFSNMRPLHYDNASHHRQQSDMNHPNIILSLPKVPLLATEHLYSKHGAEYLHKDLGVKSRAFFSEGTPYIITSILGRKVLSNRTDYLQRRRISNYGRRKLHHKNTGSILR